MDLTLYPSHIVTKYLSGDGNFRLVREMNGNKDPDDVALADGNGYFVRWVEFEDYIKVASLTPEEVSIQIFNLHTRFVLMIIALRSLPATA
jgi:hypothetical protein